MRRLGTRVRVGIAGAAFVTAIGLCILGYQNLLGWPAADDPGAVLLLRDLFAAVSFGIAGLVAMWRRPENRTGPLMVVLGVSLVALWWTFVPIPALVSLGFWLDGATVAVLGLVVLGYPAGRLMGRAERAWAVLGLATLFGVRLALTVTTPLGTWDCPDCRSAITLTYSEPVRTNIRIVEAWLLLILATTFVPIVAARWLRASAPLRRSLTPVWVTGLLASLVAWSNAALAATNIGYDDFADIPGPGRFIRLEAPALVWEVMPWVESFSLVIVPIGVAWGVIQSRLDRAAASALAVELQRTGDRPPLVESLRRALGDPNLQLGLWSRVMNGYVTVNGQAMELPANDNRAVVTRIDGSGEPLALIVHDPAVGEQSDLVQGVAAVARLALENERLQAEVRSQLQEVRASRERLVTVAEAERRRIERNLHDGAQQRLVSVSLALNMAQARAAAMAPDLVAALADANGELRLAIAELRELARGIHPAILSEAGLGPALESLAEHAPLPVSVRSSLNGMRLPQIVEGTAYFVAAEGLANVARHAAATGAELAVAERDGWLHLRISDDGRGGADPDRGTGLRGLVDRVAAVGGRLDISERAGGGTTLEAEIPCG